MAQWGDQWGELWGGAIATIDDHEEQAIERLKFHLRDKVNAERITGIFAERWQILENFLADLFTTFDIDNAFGDVQDKIGSLLGLGRQGADDDTYRVYQRTKSLILIPNRRTVEGLLTMTRSLLNDDLRSIDFEETYPKAYTLTIEDITTDEEIVFLQFLRLARPTTYNGVILVEPEPAFGFDDSTATVVTTTLGFDSSAAPPSFGGPYAHVVVL